MPRQAYILRRGEYTLKADKVGRGIPEALGGLPPGAPLNRLGLAEWLIDKKNPLTNRVIVNRIWAGHFGRGIVDTPSDFGNNGEHPSHPELLDWLAANFIESGWKIKRLHRLIATSYAYRQSAVPWLRSG